MTTINKIIENYGMDKLNSVTKYPSIMTYHSLGERGSLVESLVDDMRFPSDEDCYITEKIDGTNARIIFDGEDYIIGSREELLFAKGDRFGNPQLNIVNTIRPIAEQLKNPSGDNSLWVMYGEVYGGNVTASSKHYTNDKTFGFRLFDIATINTDIFSESIERISSWREHDGQEFMSVEIIKTFAQQYDIETVPYISVIKGNEISTDRISVLKYLQSFSVTSAGINNAGKAEGIVIRTFDRSMIRKIRFEDYEKTAKREKWDIF